MRIDKKEPMIFDEEIDSFKAFAKALPANCVFLVDTYSSIEGVKKAIEVGKILDSQGYRMVGVRLDSGDLAYLSQEARKMLDDAGFSSYRRISIRPMYYNIRRTLQPLHSRNDLLLSRVLFGEGTNNYFVVK